MRFSSMSQNENPVLVNDLHVINSNTVHNLDSYLQTVIIDSSWSKIYKWEWRLRAMYAENNYLEYFSSLRPTVGHKSGGGFPFDEMID